MMTLSGYLKLRGKKAKALTRIEAEVFGIPYPLQSGWPKRYGVMEVTQEMVERVEAQAATGAQSDDRRIRRSARRAAALVPLAATIQTSSQPVVALGPSVEASPISGFVLRQARRYRSRKSAPWA
jgi:hypothetical protein